MFQHIIQRQVVTAPSGDLRFTLLEVNLPEVPRAFVVQVEDSTNTSSLQLYDRNFPVLTEAKNWITMTIQNHQRRAA